MSGPTSANRTGLAAALVGPRQPPAGAARGIPCALLGRFALEDYLRSRLAPDSVVLCPQGRSVDDDLAFLEVAKRRLLWPSPPRDIADAIAGLVTETAAKAARPARQAQRSRPRGPLHTGLLLEGLVTRERVERALASPVRLWIVESVRCVSLSEQRLEGLARKGVRWAALRPVELAGLAVSPALWKARSRWPRWLRGRPAWRI